MDAWVRDETNGCDLGDRRLDQRLAKLLEDLSERIGKPIPLACQDWAATKAAYRFLDNPDVNEAAILQGHFQSTAARLSDTAHSPPHRRSPHASARPTACRTRSPRRRRAAAWRAPWQGSGRP